MTIHFAHPESAYLMELVPFDSTSARLHDAVNIYAAVWGRRHEESLLFFRRCARYADFRGFVALDETTTVGMVFGTASMRGQWWHDKVAAHVGEDAAALQHAWVLTELAVREQYRGQGIGAQLHHAVIEAQPRRRLLLSTQKANTGAQRFYQRHGWDYLHPGFAFNAGRPEYVIMHQKLPLPASETNG